MNYAVSAVQLLIREITLSCVKTPAVKKMLELQMQDPLSICHGTDSLETEVFSHAGNMNKWIYNKVNAWSINKGRVHCVLFRREAESSHRRNLICTNIVGRNFRRSPSGAATTRLRWL